MCGFIVSTAEGFGSQEFIARRGEDCHSTVAFKNIFFYHSLLSLTGKFAFQPYTDGKIFCVYNGEIYNYLKLLGDLSLTKEDITIRTDGDAIIPLYKKYGADFPKYLDGEFAIVLYDFENNIAIYTTDAFRSKPIYLNNDGAASYPSGLKNKSIVLKPNTTIIRDLKTKTEKSTFVHNFDFDNQTKDTYDDWILAFETAVIKRANNKKVFLGLSSGYDSGAIHCVLKKYGFDHKAFVITGDEDKETIKARGVEPLRFTKAELDWGRTYINKYMEDYEYRIYKTVRRIRNEESAYGMAYIMKLAKEGGYRIYLSGQGADEILADYAKFPGQSELKGVYPEKLKPWGNFYGHCQDAYLAKEEHVGGSFSVESRYPFLDLEVVQEFLWLSTKLKNAHYKAPLHEFFLRNKYPFKENDKRGFSPHVFV